MERHCEILFIKNSRISKELICGNNFRTKINIIFIGDDSTYKLSKMQFYICNILQCIL